MTTYSNADLAHNSPGAQPTMTDRLRHSKALIPTLAVLAVTVAALGATLVVKNSDAQNGGQVNALTAPQASPQPLAPIAAVQPAPVVTAPVTAPVRQATGQPDVQYQSASVRPAPVKVASACTTCGVVESVTTVQRQEQVQGIAGTQITPGMAIGGVVGGLLGNQIGHGNGRAAATVLGAAGGAYAGNAIQKNMKKYTAYQMRVRMADGSYRTLEQRNAIATGTQVRVEGHTLRVASAG